MTIQKRVRIIQDSDGHDPREQFDNAGRMICWHSDYKLGDEHNFDCDNWKFELACEADYNLEARVARVENEVYVTLHDCAVRDLGYDHSDAHDYAVRKVQACVEDMVDRAFDAGFAYLPLYVNVGPYVTMDTTGGNWGSQYGVIVCDRKTVGEEWDGDEEKALNYLRGEVAVYDQYLSGDVYGFVVEELVCEGCGTWEETDSCWGFYGSDPRTNGMGCYIDDELMSCAVAASDDIEYRG